MAKYNLEKTAKLKFARFGGLSSVNQRGYDPHANDFHGPPARRGFYCFVWPFYELFLLGASFTSDPKVRSCKFTYVRDDKGNIINNLSPEHDMFENCNKYSSVLTPEYNKYLDDLCELEKDRTSDTVDQLWKDKNLPAYNYIEKPSPRIFEYSGEIWHHLGEHLRQDEILKVKDCWVKSPINSYRKALNKELKIAQCRWIGETLKNKSGIPTKKAAMSHVAKDHLECFIEKL